MIYSKNYKELKKELINFNKTAYGKTIFLICYAPCVFCLFILVIVGMQFFQYREILCSILLILFLFITLIVFSIGSYAFYKELRLFVNKK